MGNNTIDATVQDHGQVQNILSRQFLMGVFFFSAVVVNLAIIFGGVLTPDSYREHYFHYGLPVLFIVFAIAAARRSSTKGAFQVFTISSFGAVLKSFLSLAALILALRLTWWVYLRILAPDLLSTIQPLAFYWRWKGWGHVAIRSVVGSPISEEILFRGWLQNWLADKDFRNIGRGRLRVSHANLVCSIAFTCAHLTAIGPLYGLRLFGVFCGSLVFGAARERTGGLAVPILLHAVANLFGDFIY